jgi:hypothetical protein
VAAARKPAAGLALQRGIAIPAPGAADRSRYMEQYELERVSICSKFLFAA